MELQNSSATASSGFLRWRGSGRGTGVAPLAAQRSITLGAPAARHKGARGVVRAELWRFRPGLSARSSRVPKMAGSTCPSRRGRRRQQIVCALSSGGVSGCLNSFAVEAQRPSQHRGEAAAVHVGPQLRQHAWPRQDARGAQSVNLKALGRQQAHVLGEHGEQAAHRELGHGVRARGRPLQRNQAGGPGATRGDIARDARGLARSSASGSSQTLRSRSRMASSRRSTVRCGDCAGPGRHVAAAAAAELGITSSMRWPTSTTTRKGRRRLRASTGVVLPH